MPHWTQPGATYFVTYRLADSVPSALLREWEYERSLWLMHHPPPWTRRVATEHHALSDRLDEWLDRGTGECFLRRADIRASTEKQLVHFDNQRYDLDGYVLMPNHVHALLVPRHDQDLFKLLQGIKGVSARTCNQQLGRTGAPFWMEDSYNRIVRDAEELVAFRQYIEANPIKANLRPNEFTLVMNDVLDITNT